MDGTGEHHLKGGKPGSGIQNPHFLSYVEYSPNTNRSNIIKTDHTKRRSLMGGECKRRKLKMWIWLIYFLYKMNVEFMRLLKSPQKGIEEKNRGDGLIWVIICENVTIKLPILLS
jgi:hypothetical protein